MTALALVAVGVGFVYNGRLQQAYRSQSAARVQADDARRTADQQREQAEEARGETQKALDLAKTYAYLHQIALADAAWRDGDCAANAQPSSNPAPPSSGDGSGIISSNEGKRPCGPSMPDPHPIAWPSAPMVGAWPPRSKMGGSSCGTWRRDEKPWSCGVIPPRCGASPIAPTGLDSPPLVRTGPSRSGLGGPADQNPSRSRRPCRGLQP